MEDQHAIPVVTVVTPSYNQARYIRATVASVLGQDYPRVEYMIADGGSTDGTREILETLPSWVSWVSRPDQGQSDALRQAFGTATGSTWHGSTRMTSTCREPFG